MIKAVLSFQRQPQNWWWLLIPSYILNGSPFWFAYFRGLSCVILPEEWPLFFFTCPHSIERNVRVLWNALQTHTLGIFIGSLMQAVRCSRGWNVPSAVLKFVGGGGGSCSRDTGWINIFLHQALAKPAGHIGNSCISLYDVSISLLLLPYPPFPLPLPQPESCSRFYPVKGSFRLWVSEKQSWL